MIATMLAGVDSIMITIDDYTFIATVVVSLILAVVAAVSYLSEWMEKRLPRRRAR